MTEKIHELLEVSLSDEEDFLKIKETLTRIGVASKKDNTLYQSCHILHKRGKYYIVHFKQMFELDGKYTDLSDNDLARRNTITLLLQDWGLLKIVNPENIGNMKVSISQIKILPHKEKLNWKLVAKYTIGAK